jgi:hypothetical protein
MSPDGEKSDDHTTRDIAYPLVVNTSLRINLPALGTTPCEGAEAIPGRLERTHLQVLNSKNQFVSAGYTCRKAMSTAIPPEIERTHWPANRV